MRARLSIQGPRPLKQAASTSIYQSGLMDELTEEVMAFSHRLIVLHSRHQLWEPNALEHLGTPLFR
jgi:hypothetical protein